jgi:hypothetical protein
LAELPYMMPASSMLRWGYQNYVGCYGVFIPGTYTVIPTSAIPTPASPILTRPA